MEKAPNYRRRNMHIGATIIMTLKKVGNKKNVQDEGETKSVASTRKVLSEQSEIDIAPESEAEQKEGR